MTLLQARLKKSAISLGLLDYFECVIVTMKIEDSTNRERMRLAEGSGVVHMKFLLQLFFVAVFILSMHQQGLAKSAPPEINEKNAVLTEEKTKVGVENSQKQEAQPVAEPKLGKSQVIAKQYAEVIQSQQLMIIIDKGQYKLHLFENGKERKVYPIAIGLNPGEKQGEGDMKTPTGDFMVEAIEDSSAWTHDFGDGAGEIEGAYGPWYISLRTDWDGIGIHGTHNPASIGTNASEGCIRMYNEDIEELKDLVKIYMKVMIVE